MFSRPVCARKQNNGPPGIDQGFHTASCNSRHALSPYGPPGIDQGFSTTSCNSRLQQPPCTCHPMAHLALTRAFLQPTATAAYNSRHALVTLWPTWHLALTRVFLQPAATAAMHCHPMAHLALTRAFLQPAATATYNSRHALVTLWPTWH